MGDGGSSTNAGHLIGSVVLIATNAFTDDLVPRLQRSVLRVHGVQIATAPLANSVRATILPQGHSCADNHILSVRFFRVEPDNRLVIGGPGWLTPPSNARALSFRILERSARRMFPQIGNIPFDYHWYRPWGGDRRPAAPPSRASARHRRCSRL